VLHHLGRDDEAMKLAELGLQLADDDAERSNAERFLLFLKQDVGYAQERARHEAFQEQTRACEGGDSAACAQILPEVERECGEMQARACMYLSWLYTQGTGLAKDAAKAAGYVERACAAGDKRACVEHAWRLIGGEGLAKDEPRGVAALQALCDGEFYPACTRLAFVEVRKVGAKTRAHARALFTRACEGGEQDACSMVEQLK
jgi:TPR repeat protein